MKELWRRIKYAWGVILNGVPDKPIVLHRDRNLRPNREMRTRKGG
jgi:hypothetical protein